MTGPERPEASVADIRRRDSLLAGSLAVSASVIIWWLHPRIGVRDGDAFAYITGAMSLRAHQGYVDLSGHALNHWPPGYSWWLSQFSQPLLAAQMVNYFTFGLAVAALFWNARGARWTVETAVALGLTDVAHDAGSRYSSQSSR